METLRTRTCFTEIILTRSVRKMPPNRTFFLFFSSLSLLSEILAWLGLVREVVRLLKVNLATGLTRAGVRAPVPSMLWPRVL